MVQGGRCLGDITPRHIPAGMRYPDSLIRCRDLPTLHKPPAIPSLSTDKLDPITQLDPIYLLISTYIFMFYFFSLIFLPVLPPLEEIKAKQQPRPLKRAGDLNKPRLNHFSLPERVSI